MSKICELQLTCPAYPELEFGIIRIEETRTQGQQSEMNVRADLKWNEKLSQMEYIRVGTRFTLTNISDKPISGEVIQTDYSATQKLPEFLIVFFL